VIFAHGSRFGGHALFVKDRRLWYVYNFLGIKPEQQFVSEPLDPGKHALGMAFVREKSGQYGESLGKAQLYVDDKAVAEGPMRTQTGHFTLCGDGLCVGFDSEDNVSAEYKAPFTFEDGTILGVGIDVSDEIYLDLEREAVAAMAGLAAGTERCRDRAGTPDPRVALRRPAGCPSPRLHPLRCRVVDLVSAPVPALGRTSMCSDLESCRFASRSGSTRACRRQCDR
jgi:hypothetical protein